MGCTIRDGKQATRKAAHACASKIMISKIINIEDYRIEVRQDNRGLRFSSDTSCPHLHLLFDENGQTIQCQDCKLQLTAWWVLMAVHGGLNRMRERLEADRKQLDEEVAKNVTHNAALKVEHVWRKHSLLPCCPHCLHAIRPTDGFGDRMVSKDDPEGARRSMISASKVLGLPTGKV